MNILSISPGHDSNITILKNGEIEFYIKEESLSDTKRDREPFKSLFYCLTEYDIPDINVISAVTPGNTTLYIKKILSKITNKEILDYSDRHHLCHASLAFYNSGFDEAYCYVIDGEGSLLYKDGKPVARETETIYEASYPANFKTVGKNIWYALGITKLYSAITCLIGENHLENGKTMGLSSYGMELDAPAFFNNWRPTDSGLKFIENYPKLNKGEIDKNNYQKYANLAKKIQKESVEASLSFILKHCNFNECKNICISGGYALNCLANYEYTKQLPKDINIYVEPNADDAGISIGAAKHVWHTITKDKTIRSLNNIYQAGTDINLNSIEEYL